MATITKPQLVSFAPNVRNAGGDLIIAMPVSNLGLQTAERVYITSLTLGSAGRKSPQSFPASIGDIAFEGRGSIDARFDARSLVPGTRVLLTVRGTIGRIAPQGFTISRYITIPAAGPEPVRLLRARVRVALGAGTWEYTIYNDEPAGSRFDIAGFHLDVVAPLGLISSPPGWIAETDSIHYVAWYVGDENGPRVQPGASLSGFGIQSATSRSEATAYNLVSWDASAHMAGPVSMDAVLSPMRP